MPLILRLAIPTPLRRLFDYLPPPDTDPLVAAQLKPGTRLRVPFGPRTLVGVLVETCDTSTIAPDALKPAVEILDRSPLLSAGVFALCQWASAYYLHPPGEIFSAALSKRLRSGREPVQDAWRLTQRGLGLADDALARAPRQAQALAALRGAASSSAAALKEQGIGSAALRELARKGLAERCALLGAGPADVREQGPTLSDEQAAAVEKLQNSLGAFSCHLLEGVTGSGKTEVYLRVIETCLARGEQALVLVPEIGLTPQTVARFRARFNAELALLHSGLGDAQRSQAWDAARTGAAHIVIGTRSAVFASCRQLGVIIVDEEHDASFRQQDGFRYSARDLAVKRGQLENCTVVLGSATPSLETLHNALGGRYGHLRLTRRAGNASLPSLETIDLRRQPLQAGISSTLLAAVENTLERGQQVLLFLNRRGFAASLQCHDCAWLAQCAHCDARLTVHRRQRQLRCHHCAARQAIPAQCPECGGGHLLTNGLGTEQTEDFLRTHMPRWPVYRVDSDAVTDHAAMQALLANIDSGDPCILLGTQMLTKGHHFPAVALVGVIDSDAMLFSADFRGEERMAQLLTQVSGRAGRARHTGRVLLQTHYPDHPLVRLLLEQDYPRLAASLLQRRLESGLPPGGQLLMVRADTPQLGTGEQFLRTLREAVRDNLGQGSQLIGPLPSALPRRAGRYRSQLLCLSADRRAAATSARALVQAAESLPRGGDLNWFLDIDPLDTL